MTRSVAALVGAALLLLATSAAAAPKATLSDIEDEVMCPTCGVALSLSGSPQAERQRALIQRLIDQGLTKEEIKARLVDEFGPGILGAPPRTGFGLAAYLVPSAVIAIALASVAFARRRREGSTRTEPSPGADFEAIVDADLAGTRR